jgi:glyoxylase-like metal-dependent hydrolase (beta-lactamase superfamily II)
MRLHLLHCGGDTEDRAVYDPFDERVGEKVYSPYFIYVIEHPEGNVMFDSGCHADLARDPRARLGALADSLEIHLGPADNALGMLDLIGMKAGDIKFIVQSHLHFDHAGGLCDLPDAEVFVQERELQFAFWPPLYQRIAYVRADFDGPVRWRPLDGRPEFDVFGDGKLIILPTPGHTAGHQSLLVRLDGGAIMLLGDAAYSVEKMRARALPAILSSPDELMRTWNMIDEVAAREDARLICTHDLDFEDKLELAPSGCYE